MNLEFRLTKTLLFIISIDLGNAFLDLAMREQIASQRRVISIAISAAIAAVQAKLGRVLTVVAQRHIIRCLVGPIAVGAVSVCAMMMMITIAITIGVIVVALILFVGDERERIALSEQLDADTHVLQVRTGLRELEQQRVGRVRIVGGDEALESVERAVDVHDAVEHFDAVLEVLEVERRLLLLAYVLELEEVERACVVRLDRRQERLGILGQYAHKLVALVAHYARVQVLDKLHIFGYISGCCWFYSR